MSGVIPSVVHLSVGATESSTLGRLGAVVQRMPLVHGTGQVGWLKDLCFPVLERPSKGASLSIKAPSVTLLRF